MADCSLRTSKTMITNRIQFELMVDFMKSNPDLARYSGGAQNKDRSNELWTELKHLLNNHGPPKRDSVGEWKKIWTDFKCNVRKKFEYNEQAGSQYRRKVLSDLEKDIVLLLNCKTDGCAVQECKRIQSQENDSSTSESNMEYSICDDIKRRGLDSVTPTISKNVSSPTIPESSRTQATSKEITTNDQYYSTKTNDERLRRQLLQNQTQIQRKYLMENEKILQNMHEELKLIRVGNDMIYELKKEHYKRKIEFMKLDEECKRKKLRLMDLQISKLENQNNI